MFTIQSGVSSFSNTWLGQKFDLYVITRMCYNIRRSPTFKVSSVIVRILKEAKISRKLWIFEVEMF